MNNNNGSDVQPMAEGPLPSLFFKLLARRSLTLSLLGVSLLQALLTRFDLPAWSCVFYKATRVSCPGCGMSRSMASLLKGDFAASWSYHPFAVFYVIGAVILATLAILPSRPRHAFLNRLRAVDTHLGITIAILGLQIAWGIWRIITELRHGSPLG